VLVTIKSVPSGLTVSVDGVEQVTPYTFTPIVGSQREAAAPQTATLNGTNYAFDSWTVGSAPPGTNTFVAYTAPTTALQVVARYTAT
jgi:hypothetical protein